MFRYPAQRKIIDYAVFSFEADNGLHAHDSGDERELQLYQQNYREAIIYGSQCYYSGNEKMAGTIQFL